MDAIQRYEQARQIMNDKGRNVPPQLLTDYIQTMRTILKFRPGLCGKTITIGQNIGTVLANEGLLRAAIETGWDVRVSGQKF